MKLLVLATYPVDAGDVRRALGDDDLDGSEVLVAQRRFGVPVTEVSR